MAKYERKKPVAIKFDFLDEPVFVRILSAQEKWNVEARCPKDPDTGNFVSGGEFMAEIALASIVDAANKPVFVASDLRTMDEDDLASIVAAVTSARTGQGSKKNWQTINVSPSA